MPKSIVSIDSMAATPPFEQIRTQIMESVRTGALAPGTRLPTVRALATELGIATNTVARAYRELERDDMIETRGRMGSFIAPNGDAAHRHAQEAASAFAARIDKLGIDPDEALGLVTQSLGALPRTQ